MGNPQQCILTDNELQLLISLYLGDGCFIKPNVNSNYYVATSCVNEDSLIQKKSLTTNISFNTITKKSNAEGYNKKGIIYKMHSKSDINITNFYLSSLEEKLNLLDELGLALWFYDDGSLHKTKHYYNLCTHSFSYEENQLIKNILEKKFNIKVDLRKESKKDGRIFWYLSVGKYHGANYISECMNKYKIPSMSYKVWCSTTIQQWSTLQEKWKREGQNKSLANFSRLKVNKFVKI